MTKKSHPVDASDIARIKTATHFNVHRRLGTNDKINVEAKTLVEAIEIARQIEEQHPGKPAMIYAITPEETTVFVTKKMLPELLGNHGVEADASGDAAAASAKKAKRKGNPEEAARQAAAMRERIMADAHAASNAMISNAIENDPELASMVRGAGRKAALSVAKASDGAAPAKDSDYPVPASASKPKREPKAKAKASKKNEAMEAAQRGELPQAPDFSKDTHKPWLAKLAEIVAMIEAGDLAGLKANGIEPKSSSRVIICRYRDLAIMALEARAAQPKAA